MDQRTIEYIARINRIDVTAEDLLLLSKEVHELPPDDRGFEGRTICALRLFGDQKDKALTASSRLEALAKLINYENLPHWAKSEDVNGARIVAEPVFIAAAKEPVLFSEDGPIFNLETFLHCALEQSEVEGQG